MLSSVSPFFESFALLDMFKNKIDHLSALLQLEGEKEQETMRQQQNPQAKAHLDVNPRNFAILKSTGEKICFRGSPVSLPSP